MGVGVRVSAWLHYVKVNARVYDENTWCQSECMRVWCEIGLVQMCEGGSMVALYQSERTRV